FHVIASSFLTDLVYRQDTGLGGLPNYWGTWSGTNLGNWDMNFGISTVVKDGELFGCSYTDFNPALRPDVYELVRLPGHNTSIQKHTVNTNLSVYPNPFQEQFNLSLN